MQEPTTFRGESISAAIVTSHCAALAPLLPFFNSQAVTVAVGKAETFALSIQVRLTSAVPRFNPAVATLIGGRPDMPRELPRSRSIAPVVFRLGALLSWIKPTTPPIQGGYLSVTLAHATKVAKQALRMAGASGGWIITRRRLLPSQG